MGILLNRNLYSNRGMNRCIQSRPQFVGGKLEGDKGSGVSAAVHGDRIAVGSDPRQLSGGIVLNYKKWVLYKCTGCWRKGECHLVDVCLQVVGRIAIVVTIGDILHLGCA